MAKDARDERLWRGVKPIVSAEEDDKGRIRGLGTGFVCGRDGATVYLLTCWHVVKAIGEANLRVEKRPARVVAQGDKALDLALLAVEGLPDSEVLALSMAGHPDQRFRTIGHFWANEKEQDVPDSRPLDGQLGQQRRKVSGRYDYVAAWEFSVTQEAEFDKIRAGYSGAPVFDPISGSVVAVISHQESEARGHAIAVSNLKTIYSRADHFFTDSPHDEGSGRDPWIVKTLDHLRQVRPLRDRLRTADGPVVAVVEGCAEDWPSYLADDVLLDPWPAFDDIPQEATTLNPTRYGESEDAFWIALYHQHVPSGSRPAGDREQEREAVRAWLRSRDRHLFFVSCGMEAHRWNLRSLIRAGQAFLAELARREPGMRLLMLIVCQSCREHPPWWWSLWRRHLQRTPGVLWLEPLRPLQSPDLDEWYSGFTRDVLRWLNRDRLRDELLDLFDTRRAEVRYRLVRKCLLDEGALERARVGS